MSSRLEPSAGGVWHAVPCEACATASPLDVMIKASDMERVLGMPCLTTRNGLNKALKSIDSLVYKLVMFQRAHNIDGHVLAAVAICWCRLCFDPLIRSKIVRDKQFICELETFVLPNRCSLCFMAGLHLFRIICRPPEIGSYALTAIGVMTALLANERAPTVFASGPLDGPIEIYLEVIRAFLDTDFGAAREPKIEARFLNRLLHCLRVARPVVATIVLVPPMVRAAQRVDLAAKERLPVLKFLLGVLRFGGSHNQRLAFRSLSLSAAAQEADKRRPWRPSELVRILKEQDFTPMVQRQLETADIGDRVSPRFVALIQEGNDLMRGFDIHKDFLRVSLHWWKLIYEDPRCDHFDRHCGRRFGFGTRRPRSCGFPFDDWRDTLLHCAAAVRRASSAVIESLLDVPRGLDGPRDLADMLQIQHHILKGEISEAEQLIAVSRERLPHNLWLLYALSETGSSNAMTALRATRRILAPAMTHITRNPLLCRIARNCFRAALTDFLPHPDHPLLRETSEVEDSTISKLEELFDLQGTVLTRRFVFDNPDIGWALSFSLTASFLMSDDISPGIALADAAQITRELTENLYGDSSAYPCYVNRMIVQHGAEAVTQWRAPLACFEKLKSWNIVDVELPHVSCTRPFSRSELFDWQRRVFVPRQDDPPIDWTLVPQRVWETIIFPRDDIRERDFEQCGHCNLRSLLLRRCSLCRRAKYCSRECQMKAWTLDHKRSCRRTHSVYQ